VNSGDQPIDVPAARWQAIETVVGVLVAVVCALITYLCVWSSWHAFAPILLLYYMPAWTPPGVAMVSAVAMAFSIWRYAGLRELATAVIVGAIVTGGVGFSIGFFGPMLVSNSPQGPLLGILFTGPIGFLLGAGGGACWWIWKSIRYRPSSSPVPERD
jgi:hypothetical protein